MSLVPERTQAIHMTNRLVQVTRLHLITMAERKNVEVESTGAGESTIVQVAEEDTPDDVLDKAFDSLDAGGDMAQFQLRRGGGDTLSEDEDVFSTVQNGEVLHATTAPTLG